jgi:hypothetical protein
MLCNYCGTIVKDSGRALSIHLRKCKKKPRYSYVPPPIQDDELLAQRVAESESSTNQQPLEDGVLDSPDKPLEAILPEPEVLPPRRRRLPAKFVDHVISSSRFLHVSQLQTVLDEPEQPEPAPEPSSVPQPDPINIVQDTSPNSFGVFRRYFGHFLPSRDSAETRAIDYSCDASTFDNVQQAEEERELAGEDQQQTEEERRLLAITPIPAQPNEKPSYYPFPNFTRYQLVRWFYRNHVKTVKDFQHLIDEVLLHPDYTTDHIRGMDVKQELKRLDSATIPSIVSATAEFDPLFPPSEGWKQSSVTIRLPPPNVHFKFKKEGDAPAVTVDGIHHRSLLEGITRAFTRQSFFDFHLKGFQLWWKPSEYEEPQRVYNEAYSSDAFLEMERQIPPLSEQDIQDGVQEPVVVPIMLYSDATHLANFGTASLWPIYMYIGLLSQYIRSKASSFAAFHLAYLKSVCRPLFPLFWCQ